MYSLSPKIKYPSASAQSNSNLFKHLQQFHKNLITFEKVTKRAFLNDGAFSAASVSCISSISKLMRQCKQPSITEWFTKIRYIYQDKVTDLILNFVVGRVQPLFLVEEPTFISLIKEIIQFAPLSLDLLFESWYNSVIKLCKTHLFKV